MAGDGNLAQPSVYRDDMLPWYTTALEPGLPANAGRVLRHRRSASGQIAELSGVKYTCDEFPPATFIQGGGGLGPTAYDAETRCAGFRCPRNQGGRDSEQNWQAESHNKLRRVLIETAGNCLANWDPDEEPLMFFIRMRRSNDGVPARIIEADGGGTETVRDEVSLHKRDAALKKIKDMRKRSLREFMEWADTVPLAELTNHGFNVKSHHILKNESITADLLQEGLSIFGDRNPTNDADLYARDEHQSFDTWKFEPRTDLGSLHPEYMPVGQRKPYPRRASQGNRTSPLNPIPSAKPSNFTSAAIAAATRIVKEAMDKSAAYNKARWENMSRNQYRLQPGTVIGGLGEVPKSSVKKRSLVPEFTITPEIEAAAALLTEFEASGNQTGWNRTTSDDMRIAAAGSFWMESIARKGTVPWGKDTSYKVFRNVKEYGAVGDGKTVSHHVFLCVMQLIEDSLA